MSVSTLPQNWTVLASTANGETEIKFDDDQVRVSVPGDELSADLDAAEIIELVQDKYGVDLDDQPVWEAGEAEGESVGFFLYAS